MIKFDCKGAHHTHHTLLTSIRRIRYWSRLRFRERERSGPRRRKRRGQAVRRYGADLLFANDGRGGGCTLGSKIR